MAPHSSTVAQKIPWMEEPGRLQSMGSLRVRHDCVTSLSISTFLHWRRKWQPTPVFFPGESHGRRSLVGCSPWGCTESDTTEATQQQLSNHVICCCLVAKWCLTLLQFHGLQPARLLCPQDFPGKNTGVGCNFLLPTQGLNLCLLHWGQVDFFFFTTEPPGNP